MSENWQDAGAAAEFPDDGKQSVKLGAWQVLLLRDGAEWRAYNDCCTHQASRLSPGRVRRGAIMCPLHGARFEVATGRCMGGAYADLRSFPVRENEGRIEVAVPEEAPGPGENPVA